MEGKRTSAGTSKAVPVCGMFSAFSGQGKAEGCWEHKRGTEICDQDD